MKSFFIAGSKSHAIEDVLPATIIEKTPDKITIDEIKIISLKSAIRRVFGLIFENKLFFFLQNY